MQHVKNDIVSVVNCDCNTITWLVIQYKLSFKSLLIIIVILAT